MSFDLDFGAVEFGGAGEELVVAPFVAEATLVQPGLGSVGILTVPAFSAEAAYYPPTFVAIDLRRSDVVYGAALEPALRAWAFDEEADTEFGGSEFGFVPSISRVYVSDPLYVASRPFATEESDTPSNRRFQGKLGGFSYRRSIANGSRFGGVASGEGELVIENADGELDALMQQAVAGAMIVIRAGFPDQPFASWFPVFAGTARNWTFSDEEIRVQLRDNSFWLAQPVQPNIYAGSGGIEGGDSVAGKRKPLVIGYAVNVSAVQIDAANLVYQIHDGELDAIFAIRDKGAAITIDDDYADLAALIAATIPAGEAATCLALGLFRLESEPAGTVTADAATYRSSGKATLGQIVAGVIADTTPLTSFDAATFAALDTSYPDDHGLFVGPNDDFSVEDVVGRLMAGVFGYVGFRRDGTCYAGRVEVAGTATRNWGTGKAFSMSLEALPDGLAPPPWRLRLAYAKNHTPQTDLAGSADQVWAQPALIASTQDSNVKLDYGDGVAQDPEPIDSYIVAKAIAEAEVIRQFAIMKQQLPLRRATFARIALTAEIGDAVGLAWDRLGGYRVGVNMADDVEVRPGTRDLDTVDLSLYG